MCAREELLLNTKQTLFIFISYSTYLEFLVHELHPSDRK